MPGLPWADHRRWSAEDDRLLAEMCAAHWPVASRASRLGRTPAACRYRAHVRGLVHPKSPRWSAAEENRLVDLLERHRTYRDIAKALGRTEVAVRLRCKRLGCAFTRTNGHTANAVATLMGIAGRAVSWWIRQGWLKAHRTEMQIRSGRVWMVEEDKLFRFIEDPRHWHVWEPARIRDAALREWATELRQDVRWLTVREAARRMGVTGDCVNHMIRQGRIAAVRWGNWRIREEDAVYREPSRAGYEARRWSDGERQFLAGHWRELPVARIAEQLGRTQPSVYNAAYRLGLAKKLRVPMPGSEAAYPEHALVPRS